MNRSTPPSAVLPEWYLRMERAASARLDAAVRLYAGRERDLAVVDATLALQRAARGLDGSNAWLDPIRDLAEAVYGRHATGPPPGARPSLADADDLVDDLLAMAAAFDRSPPIGPVRAAIHLAWTRLVPALPNDLRALLAADALGG